MTLQAPAKYFQKKKKKKKKRFKKSLVKVIKILEKKNMQKEKI